MLKNSKLLGSATFALLAMAYAVPAQATTPLYSGGGTLAEKVYRDIFNCYGNHAGGDLTVGLAGAATGCNAVTPYNANVEPLYVGVGSGNGKKGFVNHDASNFTDGPKTPDAVPVPSTQDFGPFYGTGTGAGWVRDTTDSGPFFPKVSFVGSDDPLTTGDVTTYNANANNWGAPIQVPALITTVAIPFKPAATWTPNGVTPLGGSSNVDLKTDTLCAIFTGAVTDWSDPIFKSANGNTALGSGAITVIYRSDGSGTTFLTSNALIHQCASTAHPIPTSWQTAPGNASGVGNNSFFINVKTAGLLPANFVGASGSGGVKAAINATAGTIGYISPDFISGVDPTGPAAANLQTFKSVTTTKPVWEAATAVNGTQILATTKAPLFTAGSCPVGTGVGQSPDGVCAHNALNFGVTAPAPTSTKAYPIGGFTFIDTYTCFASATDRDALVKTTAGSLGLLRWYFGSTTDNSSHVKDQLTANGFSLAPNAWISAAKKLLTSDQKTKIGIPGQAKTGCATVTGSGA